MEAGMSVMAYEIAVRVYEEMKCGDDQLRLQVCRAAIKYVNIRAEWRLMTVPERVAADKNRTAAHNAFIDTVNVLSRSMASSGKDNEWRRLLTDDRKIIGDFACFLVAHLGVLAR